MKEDIFKSHFEGILFHEGPDIFYDIEDFFIEKPEMIDQLTQRDWALIIVLYGSEGKFLKAVINRIHTNSMFEK